MERWRIAAIVVAALGVLLAVWHFWPRPPEDDRAQIAQVFARAARSAGERDVSGILEHVSERYRGEGGDKAELKRYLLGYLLRSEAVAAAVARLQVELSAEGGKAHASFVALLARTPGGKIEDLRQEDLVGAHRIEAGLEKEDGAWRVVTATRRDAAPQDWLQIAPGER